MQVSSLYEVWFFFVTHIPSLKHQEHHYFKAQVQDIANILALLCWLPNLALHSLAYFLLNSSFKYLMALEHHLRWFPRQGKDSSFALRWRHTVSTRLWQKPLVLVDNGLILSVGWWHLWETIKPWAYKTDELFTPL